MNSIIIFLLSIQTHLSDADNLVISTNSLALSRQEQAVGYSAGSVTLKPSSTAVDGT